MSSDHNALDLLGRLVAAEVRDCAIQNFDTFMAGTAKGKYAEAVRSKIAELRHDPDALLQDMIPVVVDETITIFLQVLDEYLDTVQIKVKEGDELVSPYEYTDGLIAEYAAEGDGWIAKYSKQRLVRL